MGGAATGALTSESTTTKSIGFNGPQYNGAYVRGALDDYTLYNAVASASDVVGLTRAKQPGLRPGRRGRARPRAAVGARERVGQLRADHLGLQRHGLHVDLVRARGHRRHRRPGDRDASKDANATVTLTATATYADSAPRTRTFAVEVAKEGVSTSIYVDDTDLNEVLVTDPYLQNSNAKMVDWLLTLDPKRFLYSFDQLAGIPPPHSPTADGSARPARASRATSSATSCRRSRRPTRPRPMRGRKAQLLAKLTTAVDGLAAAQAAYAQKDPSNAGYVAPFPVSYLPHGADGLIVPFYNLHKVLAGLIDAHQYAPKEVADKALHGRERLRFVV